jgi:hypothetical protein
VTLSTPMLKPSFSHPKKSYVPLECSKLPPRTHFNQFTLLVYPSSCIYFSLNNGPLALNYSKLVNFCFIMQNQDFIKHWKFFSILQDLHIQTTKTIYQVKSQINQYKKIKLKKEKVKGLKLKKVHELLFDHVNQSLML